MPEHRNFFGQLNTIKTLIESTCDDKWYIFVETALPAAGDALWLLLIPNPEEILENYLQPRPSRSDPKGRRSGHGRRVITRWGQLRWWQRIGFPDIDQAIANRLPGVQAIRGRNAGNLQRWIFEAIDVLDRIAWWFLLIDMGRTFVANWSSNIIESRFCTSQPGALYLASSSRDDDIVSGDVWNALTQVSVQKSIGWQTDPNGRILRQATLGSVSGPANLSVSGTASFAQPHLSGIYRAQLLYLDKNNQPVNAFGAPFELRGLDATFSSGVATTVEDTEHVEFHIQKISGDNTNTCTVNAQAAVLAEPTP